jgi:hypothetical protein
MRRREFITLLGGGGCCVAARGTVAELSSTDVRKLPKRESATAGGDRNIHIMSA